MDQTTYLRRRIQFLSDQMQSGSLHFLDSFVSSESGKQLIDDLLRVRKYDNGVIDLSSCSPLVKSLAKAIFNIHHYMDYPASDNQGTPISVDEISVVMREYFQLLNNFFVEVVGEKADGFDFEKYRSRFLANPKIEGNKAFKAWQEYIPKIAQFHGKNSSLLLRSSEAIGGLRCVIGGNSRFPDAAYMGVLKFALYADTIFIPDPLLPWIETDRKEERFPKIELIKACQTLLLLKPLVDAKLSYPAIVVFPSWEKSFEQSDLETQDGISQLILNFFSYYLNANFEDESELVSYVDGKGKDEFIDKVNHHNLFWPPEVDTPLGFNASITKYRESLKIWRSQEWLDKHETLSPQLQILNGIIERLIPQFHVRDNATSLKAQPLFWLPPHFYYFRLTSQVGNDLLRETGLLQPSTHSVLQALLEPQVAWLGNIPIIDIARLREEGCNEKFRSRLRFYVDELNDAYLENVDSVTGSVMRGIHSLLDEHVIEARRIADEYERKHIETLAGSILTLGATMYPWLDPWLGLAILAPLGKLTVDLIDQFRANKALARSLTGVLSYAEQSKK